MSGVVEVPDLIEPVPIADDFVQGIAKIEQIGPCARFVLYAEQGLPELGGATVRVVVGKVVIPIEALPAAIKMAAEFYARCALRTVAKVVPLRLR